MNNSPIRGLGFVLQGFRLIGRRGLRRFVAVPLLVNTLLFAAVIYYGSQRFEEFLNWLLPDWLAWLSWLIWPLFAVALLMVTFYTFTIVANLISAPFNSLLAERVEQHLTGKEIPQTAGASWRKLLADVLPTILSELRKLVYFLVRAIPLLLLFLVPGINIIAPFLWMAFSAWFLCLEYGDYPLGNHGLRFTEQKKLQKERRWTALGFGGMTLVLTTVPILNFLAMPVAVAGATAMWAGRIPNQQGNPG